MGSSVMIYDLRQSLTSALHLSITMAARTAGVNYYSCVYLADFWLHIALILLDTQ